MALSVFGCVFRRTCRFYPNVLLSEINCVVRTGAQWQSVRYYRLMGWRWEKNPWRVPKFDKKQSLYEKELTEENESFLEQTVLDKYKDKLQEVSSPLKDGPWKRSEWTKDTRRTGVLALKLGVVPQWTKTGQKFYTTMFQVLDNHVVRYIPPEQYRRYPRYKWNKFVNKYAGVVVGALSMHPFQFTKAYCGLFNEAGLPPKRQLTCFAVTPDAAIQPGTPLTAMHFRVGDYVDVQAKTIERGFQGVMRRWGFKGGPASHGTTKWHRRPGCIGCGRDRALVLKGKKMPGNMGGRFRLTKALKIWRINTKYNVLYLQGPATPGPPHCFTRIYDTGHMGRRLEMASAPPMPTFYADDVKEPLPEEFFDKDLFQFTEPSIVYSIEDADKKKKIKKKT